MPASDIVIRGAREHNLRSIDLVLPRNKLICLTGVSGSGKSSLAFDTLYAEGQRRYVESLSNVARQYLGQMPKPDVDFIGGLSPSISISQKSGGTNPRSTVGTITEIYDFLRVLFARVGQAHCPQCQRPITAQTREQILQRILALDRGTPFMILAPVVRAGKGEFRDLFDDLLKQGFVRARVDGTVVGLSDHLHLDRQVRHTVEVVVDRLVAKADMRPRLAEAVEAALQLGQGNLIVAITSSRARSSPPADGPVAGGDTGDLVLSAHYACTHCGISFDPLSPQLFSFNSPQGMCLECDGLGDAFTFAPDLLVPDPRRSFQQGSIELIGDWKGMGRWRRHIYRGVADAAECTYALAPGTMLETPWEQLPTNLRDLWLWGTRDQHITFTWRGGRSPIKYGGTFQGIIPDLLSRYRNSKSPIQIARLEKYMQSLECPACHGERLNAQARAVRLASAHERFRHAPWQSLPEVCHLPVSEAVDFFEALSLDQTGQIVAEELLKEIRGRLGLLKNVGLDYLSLDRTAPTLAGGELQRIRLAGQVGSGLSGVLYILDEPSIGLHPRDHHRLLATLAQLRDMGNTVVVVEHDQATMRAADHLVDFGPGPGVRGGQVVAQGTVEELIECASRSVTGKYLGGQLRIAVPERRRPMGQDRLTVRGAAHNNLKKIDVTIPLGLFVGVTGVSGSGKSSLVNDILVQALGRDLNGGHGDPGAHEHIEGFEKLDKLIAIDQSPIGRTPRSNPATYIKVFDEIRRLFAQLPEARRRGYQPGRFSFNVRGGRCQACDGNGSNRLEMDFLADVWMTCPVCQGKRFNRETLCVMFKDRSIADVLELDIQQALELFANVPAIHHRLQTLHDVGLDYLKLGQPSTTLSGGEAQRIKLARQLVKKSTGRTLYVLDEPTTGMHFADIQTLLAVLHNFVDAGNTVLVVEHNLDVIKTADWIIDLGPEGGEGGGEIVATGTPEQIAKHRDSYTGQALRTVLGPIAAKRGSRASNGRAARRTAAARVVRQIEVRGARQHNLKDIEVNIDRDKMTVLCGPSGSGKSSLAMDTIYAEGQRRYVESLSTYARQFVSQMPKPHVEKIEGLSPAIAIEQHNSGGTPRSTVGTVTEIYDYLRILFARAAVPYCPDCHVAVRAQSTDRIIDTIMREAEGARVYVMAPVGPPAAGHYDRLWQELRAKGFARMRVDGETVSLDQPPLVDRRRKHQVQVVVDRAVVRSAGRGRIAEAVEAALDLGQGVVHVALVQADVPEPEWPTVVHSQHLACAQCGRSFEALNSHSFSFNSYLGWCPQCQGLGTQTGANSAALMRGARLTLAEGALLLWPSLEKRLSQLMLDALAQRTGLPLDVPFDELGAHQRRIIMQGSGETWFDVFEPGPGDKKRELVFRFQFKGLYPALEEAARLSPALRGRLQHLVDEVECSACGGSRLRDDAAAARYRGLPIDAICRQPLGQLAKTVSTWRLSPEERKLTGELVGQIASRVRFLCDVGLDYLTLARPSSSLSGGESQRIRLASQLGSGLCGVLYVLDEPTIGLHPRDNHRLLAALGRLRDLGNTLIVVEHDRDVILNSDAVLDFGPGAGKHGGQIVAKGMPGEIGTRRGSVTGPYLSGRKAIAVPTNRRIVGRRHPALVIRGARHNNLRNIDVRIPLGTLTAVTGVSGSGKSSLINDILYAALARTLHRASVVPGAHEAIEGIEYVNKVIRVDQQPLGSSPSSNPATYSGVFDLVRELFAQLRDAKLRGYTSRRFSFNVSGGRCEQCEGNGQKRIEMHFLPDVWVQCDSCRGRRYNAETLSVKFRGRSIADILDMTCAEAVQLMGEIPKIRRILQTLCDVGLDYVALGQPAPTLSGGEAQRVKLAAELARPATGQTLYFLDEPTSGLHFDDLAKLLDVLHRLVDLGNTVIVIEHNLDVVKSADWVIDLGPDAADQGGLVVAEGTPEDVARSGQPVRQAKSSRRRSAASNSTITAVDQRSQTRQVSHERHGDASADAPQSYTGQALQAVLATGPHQERRAHNPQENERRQPPGLDIGDIAKDVKMPWQMDGRRWHTQDRVAYNGEPCRWDGRILARVVDHISELGQFQETNWNSRSVVEITGRKKTEGWFFHALTGHAWLLKLKFRVKRNTFKAEVLQRQLPLKTLNQMDDLPIYGNEPRIRCQNLRGPWQEVQLDVHSLEEIDTPAFWKFLREAVGGFGRLGSLVAYGRSRLPDGT